MEQRKRIAIYGGTFDPVHSGHLEIAKQVSQLFAIDEFVFMPARRAPHKLAREVTPALHRYAMLALATSTDPRLFVSQYELDAPERQYTVDTLFQFRTRLGDSADLLFVMGADSWAEITTWRDWERLLTLADLIVVTRPGYEISTEQAGSDIAARVIDVRGLTADQILQKSKPGETKIFLTNSVMHDVSATEVRHAAREMADDNLNKLVPLEVADYIRKYKLYRNTHEV